MFWFWWRSWEQGCSHGTGFLGKRECWLGTGLGGGVSIITRKRSEVKNEQVSVERNSCHRFLCVLQAYEQIMERV